MRYAISAISQRGGRLKANDVCTFVRGCRAGEAIRYPVIRLTKEANRFRSFHTILQGLTQETSSNLPISAED